MPNSAESVGSHDAHDGTPYDENTLHRTWWLSFRNAKVQQRYDLQKKNDIQARTFACYLSFTILLAFFYSIHISSRPILPEFTSIFFLIVVMGNATFLPGIILAYALLFPKSYIARKVDATMLGNSFIFTHMIAANAYLAFRVMAGKCLTSDDPFSQLSCNPEHDSHALPQDTTLVCILFLLFFQVLVKCHDFSITITCWILTFVNVSGCIIATNAHTSFVVPIIIIIMFSVLYEYENNMMRMYILMLQQEKSLRSAVQVEAEKQAIALQAEEMKHLLGNVAHDLKTPMQGFVVGLESLENVLKNCVCIHPDGRVYSHQQLTHVAKTHKALQETCRFMFMTINRALDFSKAAAGIQLVPNLETVQIEEAAKWAIECVNNVKEKVRVIFEPVSSDICKHVITDKMWLVENLLCLISNAVKFTTEGEVVVRCLLRDGKLRFEVEDDGIGISKSKRAELFRPYRQAQRFVGGTGLGLFSLSKRVEALRGSCGVDDRDDSKTGSRFWFEIEYRPDESASEDAISGSDNERSSSRDDIEGNLGIVLLVEDSLMVQKVTGKALRHAGWSVEVADNGDIGLRMMKEKKYAVVLMDLQMPVMDGLESVRRLRQYEMDTGVVAGDRQVIIGVSANSDSTAEASSMSVGMDGFIPKPFTMRQLSDYCSKCGIKL